jgi:hypothetical protein
VGRVDTGSEGEILAADLAVSGHVAEIHPLADDGARNAHFHVNLVFGYVHGSLPEKTRQTGLFKAKRLYDQSSSFLSTQTQPIGLALFL